MLWCEQRFISGNNGTHFLWQSFHLVYRLSRKGLFYQFNIQIICASVKLNRLFGGVSLVGIDTKYNAASEFFTKLKHSLYIFIEVFAQFYLQNSESILNVFCSFLQCFLNILNTDSI